MTSLRALIPFFVQKPLHRSCLCLCAMCLKHLFNFTNYMFSNLMSLMNLFLAEEAGIRLPGQVRRRAAGPGTAFHQHLPAGPQSKTCCSLRAIIVVGIALLLPYFLSKLFPFFVACQMWTDCFPPTSGSKPVNPGQCTQGSVQYPCPHNCPHHDAGH